MNEQEPSLKNQVSHSWSEQQEVELLQLQWKIISPVLVSTFLSYVFNLFHLFYLTVKLEKNGLAENPVFQKFSVFFTKLQKHKLQMCEREFSHVHKHTETVAILDLGARSLILI